MLFTEFRFLAFFALVFTVHWCLRGPKARKAWLLLASYGFYAAWDWRFLSLILGSTLVDYFAGLRIQDASSDRGRKWALRLSLFANLGILGFFKYCNFFLESTANLLSNLGFEPNLPTLAIILPVGVSFFTFQTMSYSLDIYFKRLAPTRSLLDLSLFVGFFPQLVAGPIVRASDFLPQLATPRKLASIAFKPALFLFLSGFIKKAVISDNLAPLVDAYFADPSLWSVAAAWIAVPAYAVQIYCDFSGYSDMAIASAAMLGYRLCLNFDAPYLAVNIQDFWRRWHISLSSWLRDYLYFPLGGNHGSKFATYRNLMLTMLLGGLWHGASWNFVLWGGLHGLALALHRLWHRGPGGRLPDSMLRRGLSTVFTFWFVCVCWIFFRAPDFDAAWTSLQAFVLFQGAGEQSIDTTWLWLFAALIFAHEIAQRLRKVDLLQHTPTWLFSFFYGILFALTFAFMRVDHPPFIYFQF
ncbi:MAG: MBOAT family protein [Planctomycetota bacterium]|nr:MBOAT family protein [Planctomycetota bacterium]MDA1114395.1 MBOAT family protein [Planctomycetota bacterium]